MAQTNSSLVLQATASLFQPSGATKTLVEILADFFKNTLNTLLDKIFEMVDEIKGVPYVRRDVIK